jgi:hypothetical protein
MLMFFVSLSKNTTQTRRRKRRRVKRRRKKRKTEKRSERGPLLFPSPHILRALLPSHQRKRINQNKKAALV